MSDPHNGWIRDHPMGVPAARVPDQTGVPPPPPVTGLPPISLPPYSPAPGWPPPPYRKRRTGLIVGLVLAIVVLFGTGGTLAAVAILGKSPVPVPGLPQKFTAHGTLLVVPPCSGWGYSDISDGVQAVLTDEAGRVLSVGALVRESDCKYSFTLPDVPTGVHYYGITISHRGTVRFTEQQLRDGPALTIG